MTTKSRFNNWITAHWRDCLLEQCLNAEPVLEAQIKTRLASAVVVEPDDILDGRVQFGSVVTVFSIDEEEEQTFQIVSRDESFSGRGLLDESSPLAQSIFGAREGEVVLVKLGNGSNCNYEITHIRVPSYS